MFDIGFSELLIVFVVGLLILGPDKLPHAAKTAGLWIRKIRRTMHSVQREINMQLDQEELQQKLADNNQQIMKETQDVIQNTITPLPESMMEKVSTTDDTDSNRPKDDSSKKKDTLDAEQNKQPSHSTND